MPYRALTTRLHTQTQFGLKQTAPSLAQMLRYLTVHHHKNYRHLKKHQFEARSNRFKMKTEITILIKILPGIACPTNRRTNQKASKIHEKNSPIETFNHLFDTFCNQFLIISVKGFEMNETLKF